MARGQGCAAADLPGRRRELDRSVLDVAGAVLVVSQFTLIADSKRQKATGNRPDLYERSAEGTGRAALRAILRRAFRALGVPVETGVFGAHMELELLNDGPVTFVLDVDPSS